MAHFDYLVVGQGIAGTMLTHFLLKRGKKVLVADMFNPSSASRIAAGLVNPITGKRFVKTWRAGEILPFAVKTYTELEKEWGRQFWFGKNIVKVLPANEDKAGIVLKIAQSGYQEYIVSELQTENQLTAFEITQGGYVDMACLIETFRERLDITGNFVSAQVEMGDLEIGSEQISWNGRTFGRVIFCEGYKAIYNPLFSWLPFVPAKGEVLTIFCEQLGLDKILINDVFLLPLGKGYYKVGATHQWDSLDETATEEGKHELTQKLERIVHTNYTIVDHQAGIRPTIKDRRPFLGMHPKYNHVGIFNGLGTKGASLAPYFANHFVEFLEQGKPLDKEVDIMRF